MEKYPINNTKNHNVDYLTIKNQSMNKMKQYNFS